MWKPIGSFIRIMQGSQKLDKPNGLASFCTIRSVIGTCSYNLGKLFAGKTFRTDT